MHSLAGIEAAEIILPYIKSQICTLFQPPSGMRYEKTHYLVGLLIWTWIDFRIPKNT